MEKQVRLLLPKAMLFDAGSTDRLGRVDDGTSVMDFEPEEIKRSLTISSSFNHLEWRSTKSISSTPRETPISSWIRKTACRLWMERWVVVDAISGVEVTTEKVWDYANQFNLPRIFFVSKMDANGPTTPKR